MSLMFDFKLLQEPDDEYYEKEIIHCFNCNKVIKDDYYFDRASNKVYCSKECYLKSIEKEYYIDD